MMTFPLIELAKFFFFLKEITAKKENRKKQIKREKKIR